MPADGDGLRADVKPGPAAAVLAGKVPVALAAKGEADFNELVSGERPLHDHGIVYAATIHADSGVDDSRR